MSSTQNQQLIQAMRAQARPSDDSSFLDHRRAMEAMATSAPPPGTSRASLQIDSLACEWTLIADEETGALEHPTAAVLYLHGGGFTIGSIATHRALVGRIAAASRVPALSIDYRLAPEHPYPAALDDVVGAYRWLLDRGVPPERLIVAGDSAGGGLTVAALVHAREHDLPRPAAGVLLSPWVDLSLSGESVQTLADVDPMLEEALLRRMAAAYRGELPPESASVSPLFADLSGLPPLLIQVGSREILLDDAIRLAERARAAKVSVELEIGEDLCHIFQLFASFVPEAREAIDRVGAFIRKHLFG